MRRAAHLLARDSNEPELIGIARGLGALAIRIHEPVDWLIGWQGRWVPTEIKNPSGRNRYEDGQVKFLESAAQWNLPVWTWRTEADVLACLGAKVAA